LPKPSASRLLLPFVVNQLVRQSIPLIIVAMVILLQFLPVNLLQAPRERLDGLLYDLKIERLPPWPDSVTNIQIVDIDEYSLAKVGRMPWSRATFAQLTNSLSQLGAVVISYDILFSEPQTNPAERVITHIGQTGLLDAKSTEKLIAQFDYDQHFANAMQENEVVTSVLLHNDLDNTTKTPLRVGELRVAGVEQRNNVYASHLAQYTSYAATIEKLAKVSAGQGFMNSFEDADGFVRRVALIAELDKQLIPSLALETFRIYSLAGEVKPQWQTFADRSYLQGVQVGNTFIATDNEGKIYVPYRGAAKTYSYTSAAEVLANNINDDRFDQAVVFVGTSATGLGDLRSTPVTLGFPGVEIQATVFDALISPQFIPYKPEWWAEATLIQLLIIGLLAVLLLSNRSPLLTSALAILIFSLVTTVNILAWYHYYLYLPLFCPLLLSALLAGWYVAQGFFFENRKRREVKAIFDQYVPPAHIDRLLKDHGAASLEGEKKVLSVMFSDIRSFTSISESMSAGELKQWLNQFFSPITACILQHDGTIDKYVGDMVMAFWGAPLEDAQHANKAVRSAFAMLQQLAVLNRYFRDQQKPEAYIGIGINTGEMNVGDMGSSFRRSYTVIGDAVNLGSRLEGLTKFYGVTILVSETTKAEADNFSYILIDKVKVKGKNAPVTIYSPLVNDLKPAQIRLYEQFNQCLDLYFSRQFEIAYDQLQSMLADFPNQHLVHLYQSRIKHFLQHPPAENWDGSYTHTTK
jgi:adenylate cyclase